MAGEKTQAEQGSPGPERANDRVRAQQVDILFKNVAPGVLGAGAACIALEFALIRLQALDNVEGFVWFGFLLSCIVAHLALLHIYRRRPFNEGSWRPFAAAFTTVAFLEGASWGWASVYLDQSPRGVVELLVVCVTLVIATGAISAFGSYLPAFFAFFAPASAPYAVFAFFAHDPALRETAWLMPIFFVTMTALAMRTARSYKELVRLRLREAELAEHLQSQIVAAEEANLAKSNFLAAASHDLRQPVHAIGMFVGALSAVKLPPEALRLTRKIEASVAALDGLFAALLDISRLDAGAVEVNVQSFAIQPLIDRICEDYAGEAAAKAVRIARAPSSARIVSDPILIERILRNLIANAVRYTKKGRVLVGCRRRGDKIRVEVWDSGVGVAPADQERIFQEYFQLDNPERDREKGLGLGLAIVRRLIKLLDLPFTFRSAPGRGSCFAVTLPAARGEALLSESPRVADIRQTGRGLIAVIDDEAPIRDGMTALLEGWGYSVVAAGSGDEIVGKFAASPFRPDLIISDCRLRDNETGVEVVARLQSEFNEAIPAMLITGDTGADRLAEANASGMPLLYKPVANSKLRAAIVHLMAAALENAPAR